MRRWLLCGVAVIGMGLEASAADMPDFLRGSQPVVSMPSGPNWGGFYVGGHVGYSATTVDFANNTESVSAVLAGTPVRSRTDTPLGNMSSTHTHFGAFAGYQQQWDGAVVGLEAAYNWVDKPMMATNVITGGIGIATDNLVYYAPGAETARIVDYGTLRVRGGWAANSWVMPYATFGLAVGRVDINRTVFVATSPTQASPFGAFVPPPFVVSQNLNNQVGYGYAAGVGADFCLMANLFARLEYEYVQFPDFQGLNVHMHNVRLGAAFKF